MKSYLSVTIRYATVTSILDIYFIVASGRKSLAKNSIAKKILFSSK
jgi:hypothetical protein